jgi:F-type H+-transporting ATPase subunit b
MERVAQAIRDLVEIGLSIDPWEMLIQIVATVLLILVVKFFFWGKITAFIDARREFIDKELVEATERNEEASMLKAEAEKAFEQVKQEARQIIEEAKTRGEDSRRELIAKAKDEATNIKKSAQKDLAQEIEVAKTQIRNEIIEVASVLAQKVIDQEIDKQTYDRLIDQAIEEVRNR